MKISKIILSTVIIALVFIVGCSTQQSISEESLGLRKTDIYTENTTQGDKTMYGKSPAGTSKTFKRAFENSPPMIPHDTEGMMPITISYNACTGCHVPAVASSMNATPIPKTHFTSFRPTTSLASDGRIMKNGKKIVNTSDIKTSSKELGHLSGSRFNCTQCHAPQSTGKLVVENEFEADFRKKGANKTSNLMDNINEGVK